VSPASELEEAREATNQNSSVARRMIREALETLGPSGILPSEDAVLALYGPEPVDEATAIVKALRQLLAR
jgi:hypothetical protein